MMRTGGKVNELKHLRGISVYKRIVLKLMSWSYVVWVGLDVSGSKSIGGFF
jgi:hypothetical protein